MAAPRGKAYEAAKALERAGKLEAALRAYSELGALEDAARLLVGQRRFGDAGRLLFTSLGVPASQVASLTDTQKRKRAAQAAVYLAKGGDLPTAVELLTALPVSDASAALAFTGQVVAVELARRLEKGGRTDLALELLHRQKNWAEAGRLARSLGKSSQAAELYARASRHYEAATCFFEAGNKQRYFESLLRVTQNSPHYRAACAEAIRVAGERAQLGLELEQLLAAYVKGGPANDAELESFYEIGALYKKHGFLENAREALGKLVQTRAGYKDAEALLASLGTGAAERLPDLPELPDLPAAPSLPDPTRTNPPSSPPGKTVQAGALFVIGATIAERYRLDEQIGHGGMAVVFRATDLELGEAVAIKVFRQATIDEEAEARFKRELKLSRQLVHPNVIRLFDIGLFGGFRYISMELLAGSDLRKLMSSAIPFDRGLSYLEQACAGLQAAHDLGIVHRDMKPENCFISGEGTLKLMDFGIAKMQSMPGVTATGIIAGTPGYISPEQINNFSGVNHLTDIYAMGCMAYEMFTRKPPFHHPEPMSLLMMHLLETPAAPRSHNPETPAELDQLILQLLEKEPSRRVQSCRELGEKFGAIRKRLAG